MDRPDLRVLPFLSPVETQAPREVPGLATKLTAFTIVCCLPQSQLSPEAGPCPLKLLYNEFPPQDSVEDSTEVNGRHSEEFPGSTPLPPWPPTLCFCTPIRLPDMVVQGQGPGWGQTAWVQTIAVHSHRSATHSPNGGDDGTFLSCEGASGRQCEELPTGTCTAQEDQEKEEHLISAPLPLLLKACRGTPNKKGAHSCCRHLELKGHLGIQGAGVSESRGMWG